MVPDHQDKIVQDQKVVNKAINNNNNVQDQDQIVHQDKIDLDHNKMVSIKTMIML
jgi:hypothetical protein